MAGTLNITNIVQAITASGQPLGMFQGPIGGVSSTPLNIANLSLTNVFGSPSFTGNGLFKSGTLATASVQKVFDSSADIPATWNYFMAWSDQPLYIQFITSATNVILQILPTVPFAMSVDGLLAAAATTAITSSQPTLVAIAKIYLGNYTGITANWQVLAYL
jgi:hypothetical protein